MLKSYAIVSQNVAIFLRKRYLFLFLAALGLCGWTWTLIVESGGYALDAVHGLLIAVAPLVVKHRLSGTWASAAAAPGFRVQAQSWCTGFVAPQHVGSPRTGGQISVP